MGRTGLALAGADGSRLSRRRPPTVHPARARAGLGGPAGRRVLARALGGGRRLGLPRARRRAAPAVARPPRRAAPRHRARRRARVLGAPAPPALLAAQRRVGGDPRHGRLPLLVLLLDARARTRRPSRRGRRRRVRLAEPHPARRRAGSRLRRGSDREPWHPGRTDGRRLRRPALAQLRPLRLDRDGVVLVGRLPPGGGAGRRRLARRRRSRTRSSRPAPPAPHRRVDPRRAFPAS